MKYLRGYRQCGLELGDNDPMGAVANLFDIGLVFIVGLLLALFGSYHLDDLLKKESNVTITSRSNDGTLNIIVKKGHKIEAFKVSSNKSKGRGERLGVAYRLQDGSMIYVPETEAGK